MDKLTNIMNTQKVRSDAAGSGIFGARRGKRTHKGLDLLARPGERLRAPISGRVTYYGYPYHEDTHYRYLEITGDVYRVRVYYMAKADALRLGTRVTAGQDIGQAQDIAAKHGGGMRNHIHVELYVRRTISVDEHLTDPAPFLSLTR